MNRDAYRFIVACLSASLLTALLIFGAIYLTVRLLAY